MNDVFICKLEGDYKARPSTLIVRLPPATKKEGRPPHEIWFKNLTDDEVSIVFPGAFLAPDLNLAPGGRGRAQVNAAAGAYIYLVAIPRAGAVARGDSAPIIIIDP